MKHLRTLAHRFAATETATHLLASTRATFYPAVCGSAFIVATVVLR